MHLTSRQADILELVAAGLPDKQIALRLGVSRRTVRTHLEKLFAEHGVRSRAEAVALWLRRSSAPPPSRPADECPYPKPFAADFDECPAYQPRQVSDFDLSYGPLGRSWTCRHLVSRRIAGADHRWYGACTVGDVNARDQWAAAVGSRRLRQVGDLRQELTAVGAPFVESLWALKGQQLQALHSKSDPMPATEAMKELAARLLTAIGTFLEPRRATLDGLHLPLDACIELTQVALRHLITQDSAEFVWEIPDSVLERFPEDARLFLKPGHAMAAKSLPGGAHLESAAASVAEALDVPLSSAPEPVLGLA
jgi:DNA-binding CsgD family transcriptional regulator